MPKKIDYPTPTHISLLRGINVGGHKKIRMADLKALYESLGFVNVTTYAQSGNVVFQAEPADAGARAAHIEGAIAAHFGFAVTVLLRSAEELRAILDANPFPDAEPKYLHVLFLSAAPDAGVLEALAVPAANGEAWRLAGREIYLHYPNGSGRSKMTGAFFERKLGVAGSARNWNSVNALYELARQ
ncbi:MAG: DUF1697 domain-containing protein [Caldilineaceae bacterium]|nr:DUF1697 domain-containing protein [Caldilineaceae bacterium]